MLFSLLLVACKKMEFDKITKTAWNPNLAVPLAFSTFDVYDILAREDSTDLVVIDPNTGAIALVYSGEIFSFEAQDIVDIPDFSEQFTFASPDLGVLPEVGFSGTLNASNNETFTLNTSTGVELHTVRFNSGNISLDVSTSLRHNVTINLTFPDLISNGAPVVRTLNLNYSGTVPQTATASIDLTDVNADLTLNGTTVNSLRVICNTTIQGTGQNLSGTENISLNVGMTNLNFKNITGYFGQQSVAVDGDTILMKLFQSAVDGHFELTNPSVTFTIENSFGFPARINLNNLKTINVNTGQEYPLTGYPTVINIASPANMGETATTTLELNTSNTGNLNTIISPVPKYFYFEAAALSNPAGQTANLNFAEDVSALRIKADLELPMEGFAYGFSIKDTVDFNLGTDIDMIEYVMFRLIVDNGFPVQLGTQLKFMDENYNVLFSTFNGTEYVVQPALVDSNGKVYKNTKKISDITLTETQIPLLDQVKYLEIEGVAETLNGTSGQIVKLFDTYKIGVKLSVQVEGKTSF